MNRVGPLTGAARPWLAAAVLFAAAACGGTAKPGDALVASVQQADAICAGPGLDLARQYDPASTLVRAFPSTAATVADWQETRHGPGGPRPQSPLRSRAAGEAIGVCYFEG